MQPQHFDADRRYYLKTTMLAVAVERLRPILPALGIPNEIYALPEPITEFAIEFIRGMQKCDENSLERMARRTTAQYGDQPARLFFAWVKRRCDPPWPSFFQFWSCYFTALSRWPTPTLAEGFALVSENGRAELFQAIETFFGDMVFNAHTDILEQIELVERSKVELDLTRIPGFEPPDFLDADLSVRTALAIENSYRTLRRLRECLSAADWQLFIDASRRHGPPCGLREEEIALTHSFH